MFTALLFTSNVIAQTYKPIVGSSVKVNGTSNIHDWTMEAKTIPAEVVLEVEGTEVKGIKSLNLTLPVKSLKGKEDLLNTRAYKAMKEDAHKNISFKMTSGSVAQNVIKVNGTLTIAGVSKPVALQAKASVNADGTVTVVGSRKLKMSDHGIAPPSFMLGALKVVDDITIEYNLKLKK
ncbi:YceI family protein [Pseudoxanthomonas sp. SGD-10]|nr:YceI family protein [Pseudoxanthomonas sp. SGD-10]